MIAIPDILVKDMAISLRVKSLRAEDEIRDLASACVQDLEIAGVYAKSVDDPLVRQAIRLFCKAHYGYDENTEKFEMCYNALRDSMALCGDYSKVVEEHV